MDTGSSETDQEQLVGVIKQTLVSSPVIKRILQCQSSSGNECLVKIRVSGEGVYSGRSKTNGDLGSLN